MRRLPVSRSRVLEGPYDLAFVEGSITTPDDARRIEVAIMTTADRQLYREFEELGGRLDANNEVAAPRESALAVASYVVDDTREWLAEQAGGLDARALLVQAGVARDEQVLLLSSERAKDPAIYRAAREVSQEVGKVLSIAGDNGAGAPKSDGEQQ